MCQAGRRGVPKRIEKGGGAGHVVSKHFARMIRYSFDLLRLGGYQCKPYSSNMRLAD